MYGLPGKAVLATAAILIPKGFSVCSRNADHLLIFAQHHGALIDPRQWCLGLAGVRFSASYQVGRSWVVYVYLWPAGENYQNSSVLLPPMFVFGAISGHTLPRVDKRALPNLKSIVSTTIPTT